MTYAITLHVEGPTVCGDLRVEGFSTRITAAKVGERFARALDEHFNASTTVVHEEGANDDHRSR